MSINLKEFGLFKQLRIGHKGEGFYIYKIKTMISDSTHSINDKGVASLSDNRITKVGSILRRLHVDELPQLFSVFIGKMSFIGPRPEVTSIMETLSFEDFESWTRVKPGLISPATLSYINEEELLEDENDPLEVYLTEILPIKVKMNKEYSDEISFSKDLKIFFNYLWKIIKND
mgnify:FL=1|tara:strand:+ start:2751 stop:3272 length:522 start_codon:yes stop_codon:yes gene_type:complete